MRTSLIPALFATFGRSMLGVCLTSVLLVACGGEEEPHKLQAETRSDAGSTSRSGKKDATVSVEPAAADDTDAATDDTTLSLVGVPTWHQHIAPIVIEKCSSCHMEGGIAPFSVQAYDSAKPFAKLMAQAVEDGTMPPFLAQETNACKPPLPWLYDLHLSADQKSKLRAWADHGAPEGDPAAPAPVKQPLSGTLEREDYVAKIPTPFTVEGTQDIHACVIVDPGFDKDVYVTGRMITAGNPKVLHHVVSYVVSPGTVDDPIFGPLLPRARTKDELNALLKQQKGVGIGESYPCFGSPDLAAPLSADMVDAWAPGGLPNLAPPDSGQLVTKDSVVIMDIHYHPTGGQTELDATTKLSFMTTDQKPVYGTSLILLGNFTGPVTYPQGTGDLIQQPDETKAEFMIPANVKDHIEECTWKWNALPVGPLKVYGMGTHMHYVGRGMRVTVDKAAPDGGVAETQCLIETPSWDFNWQRGYGYDTPSYDALPELAAGDVMHLRCTYDNTMGNKFVAQALEDRGLSAPIDVPLGEDTLDEMCIGALGIMWKNP